MKTFNTTLLIFALIIFSCKKDNVNPANGSTNNTNNTNHTADGSVWDNWMKVQSNIEYDTDGVTVLYDQESTFDAQGRTTDYKYLSKGVLQYEYHNYNYSGSTATYTLDFYSNGTLTQSNNVKTVYLND